MHHAARRRRLRSTLVAFATFAATLAAPVVVQSPAAAGVTPSCAAAGITVTGLGGPNFYIDNGSSPEFRSGYTGYRIDNGTGSALGDVWVKLSDFTGGSLALASGQSAAQRVGDLADGVSGARFWYLTASAVSSTAQNHTITVYAHNPALPNATALCTTTWGFSSVQGTIAANANKVNTIEVSGGAPKLGSQFTVTVTGDTGTIGQGITGDAYSMWMTPAVAESWPADAFRLVGTSLTISPDGTAAPQTYTDILRLPGLGTKDRPYTASYTFRAVGFTSVPTPLKPVQEIASGTQVKHTGGYPVSLPAIPAPTNDLSFALTSDPDKLPGEGGDTDLTGTVSGTAGAELDALLLTLPPCASVRADTATWNGQPIPDAVASAADLVFSGPFVVGGTGLKVGLTLGANPGKCRVALLGAVGTARIGKTVSPTDGTNPATVDVDVNGPPVVDDKTVTTRPDTAVTINIGPLVTDPNGDTWQISGTTDGQLGTVDHTGRLVTYTPQVEDPSYVGEDSFEVTVDDGRGGTATGTITVQLDPNAQPTLIDQTIDFTQPGDLAVGGTEPLDVSASSGLDVAVTSQTPEVCSVTGLEVAAVAAGDCTLEATQDGDTTYGPAAPVTRTLGVTQPLQGQTITFTPPATVLGVDEPLVLDGGSDSGLPLGYDVVSGDCTLDGDALTAATAGTCVVRATQAGSDHYVTAEPVAGEITFVTAADDTATVDGNSSVDVDVTANDPAGVSVASAGAPAHGTTSVVGDRVRYTPAAGYRGTDSFGYTVTDDSHRTSRAHVLVSVGNLAPSVAGARVTQMAGTSTSETLAPTDPNGDPVSLTAVSASPEVSARVTGHVLTLAASAAVSGVVRVVVTADDGAGGTATAVVTTVVTPVAPQGARRTLDERGTKISWQPAPTTDARYEVLVDGRPVCSTVGTACRLDRIAGPRTQVVVRTVGRDDTRSTTSAAPLTGHGQVLITTVYFDSGSAALTRADRRTLGAAIRTIHHSGFAHAWLDGYTDSDGGLAFNLALSHRRTSAVATYLRDRGDLGSTQSWHGENDPVASNQASPGKARNRRVEVLVRY